MKHFIYFKWSFIVTALGLLLGLWLGWATTGTVSGALSTLFICAVLAVLEISLSFDNAVVNANKLKTMDPVWQRRFLTWGILIAVFGMRILFPLVVVAVAAHIGPIAALKVAATEPQRYSEIMHDAHVSISAFGGTFLMMVALTWFFDEHKEIHWVHRIESHLSRYADIRGIEIMFVLLLMVGFAAFLDGAERATFVSSAVYGLVAFLATEVLGKMLDGSHAGGSKAMQGGLGAFLYLEMLDASFSFDGVIGAFALSKNLFIIAIGLGIGAMFVRSMTIMLVEKGTLAEFRYLEHGAFYAVLVLSVIMYAQALVEIPEVFTGFAGVVLIGAAFWSSVKDRKARCS